jgi:site-specific recombinase XerD
LGNWLTAEQSRTLIHAPDDQTLKGRRDHAILAVMMACGLRRSEVADLTVQHLQQREAHWVIADLIGKAAHIRTAAGSELGKGGDRLLDY